MAIEKWNESGRVWEEDHGLLDAEQVAKCERADVAEPLRSPVPTRMISNGEYMPVPQTDKQKRVEARIDELSTRRARSSASSRRQFLGSSGGMAAALLAMNEVFGRFFDVSLTELFEPAAYGAAQRRRRTCSSSTTSCTSSAAAGHRRPACGRSPKGRRRLRGQVESLQPAGRATSGATPGASGIRRSSVCRSTLATPTSRSSSRTCTWTARSRSAC